MIPEPGIEPLRTFWEALTRASRRILFLDYDGTLAPFRLDRERAFPYPGVASWIDDVRSRARTRVVIVTGRPGREIPPLLGLDPPPEIRGSHGLECLFPDGRSMTYPLDGAIQDALDRAALWVEARGWGGRIERKPGAVGLHLRGVPEDEAAEMEAETSKAWSRLLGGRFAERGGIALLAFEKGLELRQTLRTKRDAVADVLSEETGPVATAYLGDDVTDEDAFCELEGKGPAVLVRTEWRPTAARYWLRPPGDLLDFLQQWSAVCSDHPGSPVSEPRREGRP